MSLWLATVLMVLEREKKEGSKKWETKIIFPYDTFIFEKLAYIAIVTVAAADDDDDDRYGFEQTNKRKREYEKSVLNLVGPFIYCVWLRGPWENTADAEARYMQHTTGT